VCGAIRKSIEADQAGTGTPVHRLAFSPGRVLPNPDGGPKRMLQFFFFAAHALGLVVLLVQSTTVFFLVFPSESLFPKHLHTQDGA